MGFSGLFGFIFYFATFFLVSAVLVLKMGSSTKEKFVERSEIVTGNLTSDLLV